jgi:large subunit ribosomal protein L24
MQKIKKGDTVQVMAGRDKGKRGKVIEVFPEEGLVRVEGVNVQKRHLEGKVQLSNVMFFSEKLGRPVRVGIQSDADGNKMRVARGRGAAGAALD